MMSQMLSWVSQVEIGMTLGKEMYQNPKEESEAQLSRNKDV